jgi:hypothetical protein
LQVETATERSPVRNKLSIIEDISYRLLEWGREVVRLICVEKLFGRADCACPDVLVLDKLFAEIVVPEKAGCTTGIGVCPWAFSFIWVADRLCRATESLACNWAKLAWASESSKRKEQTCIHPSNATLMVKNNRKG